MTAGADGKNLLENPFRGRDPASGAAKKPRPGAAKPKQLGWPKGSAEHAPGSLLDRVLIKRRAEACRILGTARVGPGEDGGERFSGAVEGKQAVPQTGTPDHIDWALR